MSDSIAKNYFSKRGKELLYLGEPLDMPIITLENYDKWYSLYQISPDGFVSKVDSDVISKVMRAHSDARWIDHLFHPRFIYRVALELKGYACDRSIEIATGRWILEGNHTLITASEFEPPKEYDFI